tara:strand:+ start:778 stop:1203 length:426 start_codon:yes stop_codon:yes gene_type:complete
MPSLQALPFDPALDAVLATFPQDSRSVDHAHIFERRQATAPICDPVAIFTDPEIAHEEIMIPGPEGEIQMTILRPIKAANGPRPAFYNMHGSALVLGNRYSFLGNTFSLAKEFGAVVISMEYRLAPEFPALTQVEDAYAGL